MTTTTTTPQQRTSLLNIVSQPQVQSLLDQAKQRISEEEGVSFRSVNGHFKKPVERDFVAPQRAHTTLLFGGLTFRHEHLMHVRYMSRPGEAP